MGRPDVVIIGGGVIGCSTAYHLLRRDPTIRVLVLEREAMVGMGSTSKATGGIRHQFSTEENIRLTQLSLPTYLRFEEETGYSVFFRPHGYLFVTGREDTLENLRAGVALQHRFGVPSRVLAPDEVAAFVPGIRTDDLVGGTFYDEDGSAEPAAAVQGFASCARTMGAEFRLGEEVTGILRDRDRVAGVATAGGRIESGVVVIAAGPYSAGLAALAGVEVPAQTFRRQVSVAEPLPELDIEMPLLTDADSGFNMHRTGHGDLLLGGTDRDTRPGFGLNVNWDGIERVLTAGVHRVPVLVRARIRRTYVGLRSLTPDLHPILGRVRNVDGLVLACGDNGKGFMHAPAIGMLISEEIIDGEATSLDLTPLRLERFAGPVRREAYVF
jgi:sarcosine oxidase subunit beta